MDVTALLRLTNFSSPTVQNCVTDISAVSLSLFITHYTYFQIFFAYLFTCSTFNDHKIEQQKHKNTIDNYEAGKSICRVSCK